MAKITIPLMETLVLQRELQNMLTEETISFVVKFDVTTILEKVTVVTKRFSDSRLAIIKKYGNPVADTPDTFSLEDSTPTNKKKGMEELEALAEKPEEVEYKELKLEDFKDLKSKFPYRVLYQFMAK